MHQTPASLRAGGAQTVYWCMHLTASSARPAPRPAAEASRRPRRRCSSRPSRRRVRDAVIALNELERAGLGDALVGGTAAYRANVLALVTAVDARRVRGRSCSSPARRTLRTSAGDAAAWWRQLATVSDIVLEVYAQAPQIYSGGALLGRARCASRSARRSRRSSRSACPRAGSG